MDLPTSQRVAMGITLALSLMTVPFMVYRIWKLNFRLSTASDSYCSRYKLPFSFLAGIQIMVAASSQVIFTILSWSSGIGWTLPFAGSVVLSSIVKEVSYISHFVSLRLTNAEYLGHWLGTARTAQFQTISVRSYTGLCDPTAHHWKCTCRKDSALGQGNGWGFCPSLSFLDDLGVDSNQLVD